MVEIICFFFFQYLSKTAQKSFENIERLAIVYKFIFRGCHIMQLRLELISVMKFTVRRLLVVSLRSKRFSGAMNEERE